MAKKEELDNIAGNEKLRALQAAMDKIIGAGLSRP